MTEATAGARVAMALVVSERRRAGEHVTEHIRLMRELGRGAMGSVWVADHLTLETHVAVKFINRHLLDADDEDLRERFSREARSAAHIKSPHVVQIFDHGVMDDGTPYIVMELLEGESLADRLERTGWLSIKQCVQVVVQTASALAKAHKLGVVHRDIKPENIFLCPSDDGLFVKLLDFGIAKHGGSPANRSMTMPGMLIGTAEYMSREQVVSAADVDHQADLWALAVVGYEMLTGDVPFTGETVGGVWASIVRGHFLPASSLRKECPQSADVFFKRAFSFDRDDRFPSARELAGAYRDALAVEVSLHFSVPPVEVRRSAGTEVGLGRPRGVETLDDVVVRKVLSPSHTEDELPPTAVQALPGKRKWLAIAAASALGVLLALVLGSSREPRAQAATSLVGNAAPPPAEPSELPALEAPAPPTASAPPPRKSRPRPKPKRPESKDHGDTDDPTRPDYGF